MECTVTSPAAGQGRALLGGEDLAAVEDVRRVQNGLDGVRSTGTLMRLAFVWPDVDLDRGRLNLAE